MAKRKTMSKHKSQRLFTNTAAPHRYNTRQATPPRGGYRL